MKKIFIVCQKKKNFRILKHDDETQHEEDMNENRKVSIKADVTDLTTIKNPKDRKSIC